MVIRTLSTKSWLCQGALVTVVSPPLSLRVFPRGPLCLLWTWFWSIYSIIIEVCVALNQVLVHLPDSQLPLCKGCTNKKYSVVSYSTVSFLIFTAHFSASPFLVVKSQYEMSAANTTCKSMKKNQVCKSMKNWPYTENFNGTQIKFKILRGIVRWSHDHNLDFAADRGRGREREKKKEKKDHRRFKKIST